MPANLPPRFLFSFFEPLPRQGPGDDTITRSILSGLPDLPARPEIIDMGCGTGHQTLILAEKGDVTAVDIHQPFLDTLMLRSAEKNLSARITLINASMDAIPGGIGPVDLIWSEGAVYIIGFESGLSYWRTLVRPGGYVVVSELTRLAEEPPEKISKYWTSAYPQVHSADENCRIAERAGYTCIKTVKLPESAWNEFYRPQKEKIMVLKNRPLSSEEKKVLAEIEEEISVQEEYPDWYGYVFYVLRNPGSERTAREIR